MNSRDKQRRNLGSRTSLEVMTCTNALEYLQLRKKKLQNTPVVGVKLSLAIQEVKLLMEENKLLKEYLINLNHYELWVTQKAEEGL